MLKRFVHQPCFTSEYLVLYYQLPHNSEAISCIGSVADEDLMLL